MEKILHSIKKNIRFLAGIFLIFLGLIGLALPIMPGWIFIFIGLELVGLELVVIQKLKEYVKSKTRKKE